MIHPLRMIWTFTLLSVILSTIPTPFRGSGPIRIAKAQFFQHFFGGGGGEEEVSREQEPPPTGDSSWFEARVEAAQCTEYLCSKTLACVSKPSHCPCPFPQQIKCPYKDTDSYAVEKSVKSNGKWDRVDALLDQGGSFCVTATSCDQVGDYLTSQSVFTT